MTGRISDVVRASMSLRPKEADCDSNIAAVICFDGLPLLDSRVYGSLEPRRRALASLESIILLMLGEAATCGPESAVDVIAVCHHSRGDKGEG